MFFKKSAGGNLPEIKPCPYCGRKPKLGYIDLQLNTQGYGTRIRCKWRIKCPGCTEMTMVSDYRLRDSGEFEVELGGPAVLIEKWNRRAF